MRITKWSRARHCRTTLVVIQNTGYPGFPTGIRDEVFDAEFERIYNYPKWDAVQHTLLSESEQEHKQMTLEEMFCNQFVAPQNQEFFSVIEGYRENHPKNFGELNTFIAKLDEHLNHFRSMANDVESIVSALKK